MVIRKEIREIKTILSIIAENMATAPMTHSMIVSHNITKRKTPCFLKNQHLYLSTWKAREVRFI